MEKASLHCRGCDKTYDLYKGFLAGCENRNDYDNSNHILEKVLITSPEITKKREGDNNPFLFFKEFFYSYHLAQKLNVNFEEIVQKININLKMLGENEFSFTPIIKSEDLADGLVYVKNETVNISGSHKVRHIMGNIIYLEVLRAANVFFKRPKLAIYSCGNAALAAATIAKAAGYQLDVFVPPEIDPAVEQALNNFSATVIKCTRVAGQSGDPCYLRFQGALENKSLPCSCSGPDNWSNIEGGQTLFLELLAQNQDLAKFPFDSVVVQVGGGALASSAIQTIEELYDLKIIQERPVVNVVQTEGAFPLVRAYFLLIKEIAQNNNLYCSLQFEKQSDVHLAEKENQKILKYSRCYQKEIKAIVAFIKDHADKDPVINSLKLAAKNMNYFMWPWENTPHSIAHGILDDITYDWFKIIEGLFATGGVPVVVGENELKTANALAKNTTEIDVDHTGTSGLAGLRELQRLGYQDKKLSSLVLFTGRVRS